MNHFQKAFVLSLKDNALADGLNRPLLCWPMVPYNLPTPGVSKTTCISPLLVKIVIKLVLVLDLPGSFFENVANTKMRGFDPGLVLDDSWALGSLLEVLD